MESTQYIKTNEQLQNIKNDIFRLNLTLWNDKDLYEIINQLYEAVEDTKTKIRLLYETKGNDLKEKIEDKTNEEKLIIPDDLWDKLPKECEYAAFGVGGEWFGYVSEPVLRMGFWASSKYEAKYQCSPIIISDQIHLWDQSLIKRPK